VAIDPTSPVTFLPSADCNQTAPACSGHARYQNGNSTTYLADGSPWTCPHAPKEVSGFHSIDTLTIGDAAIKYQTFAEAVKLDSDTLAQAKYDGVLGLELQNNDRPNNVLTNLVKQQYIPKADFAVWYSRDLKAQVGGQLSLGGVDDSKHDGAFTEVPVIVNNQTKGNDTWSIQLSSIQVLNYGLSVPCKTFLAPGSAFIGLIQQTADQIHKYLEANTISPGKYSFDCTKLDKLANITLLFGDGQGKGFVLTKDDYVTVTDTPVGKYCMSNIVASPQEDGECFLGAAFIGRYYAYAQSSSATLTNKGPSISFANSKP